MRSEKQAIKREIQETVATAEYMFIVEYQGMKVTQVDALRRQLRKQNAHFRVFKNTFLRHACAEREWPETVGNNIGGMVAVVVGDDPVAAARSLKKYGGKHKVPVLRGGILGNAEVTAQDIEALAALPTIDQLRGQVVGALASPMSGLVGVLNGVQSQLVRVLKAVENKKSAA